MQRLTDQVDDRHERPVVAFDIDGTVFDIDDAVDQDDDSFWADPDRVAIHTAPNDLARRALVLHSDNASGADVVFVTGRTFALQAVTEAQLRSVGFDHPIVDYRPTWIGLDHLAEVKAEQLHGATVYIGDQDHDRDAARMARIPFIHVNDVASEDRIEIAAEVYL